MINFIIKLAQLYIYEDLLYIFLLNETLQNKSKKNKQNGKLTSQPAFNIEWHSWYHIKAYSLTLQFNIQINKLAYLHI